MRLLLAVLLLPAHLWALGMVGQIVSSPLLYEDAARSLNPHGYYRLEDKSGTTGAEDTGLHPATFQNGPTLNAAPLIEGNGSAVSWASASSQYATITDSAAFDLDAAYTYAVWFSTPNTGAQVSFSRMLTFNTGGWYALTPNSGTVVFVAKAGGAGATTIASTTTTLDDGNRHFVVITMSDTGRLYVDGVEEATGALANPSSTDSPVPEMGRRGTGEFFYNGTLDEIFLVTDRGISNGQQAMLHRIGTGQDVFAGDYIAP